MLQALFRGCPQTYKDIPLHNMKEHWQDQPKLRDLCVHYSPFSLVPKFMCIHGQIFLMWKEIRETTGMYQLPRTALVWYEQASGATRINPAETRDKNEAGPIQIGQTGRFPFFKKTSAQGTTQQHTPKKRNQSTTIIPTQHLPPLPHCQ